MEEEIGLGPVREGDASISAAFCTVGYKGSGL